MGIQPRKRGQQRGMDVEQPALVAPHEARGEYAHEAGQHHQAGAKAIDRLRQRRIEGLARGVVAVRNDGGGDAAAGGVREPGSVGDGC